MKQRIPSSTPNTTVERVQVRGGSQLFLVSHKGVVCAQIEKLRDTRTEKHPFKVFSCDTAGRRLDRANMVVFYPGDGGFDAAVEHAASR